MANMEIHFTKDYVQHVVDNCNPSDVAEQLLSWALNIAHNNSEVTKASLEALVILINYIQKHDVDFDNLEMHKEFIYDVCANAVMSFDENSKKPVHLADGLH